MNPLLGTFKPKGLVGSRKRNAPGFGGGGGAIADPYAAYLVYDSFTEAGDTLLESHTPEKGGTWVKSAGASFVVKGGLGIVQSGSNAGIDLAYVIDAGAADVTIVADVSRMNAVFAGIAFNYQDASNYWQFAGSTNNSNFYLLKTVAGVQSTVNTLGNAPAANSSHLLQVQTIGDRVILTLDSVQLLDTTIVGRQFKTATKHGLYSGFNASTQEWDIITITSP